MLFDYISICTNANISTGVSKTTKPYYSVSLYIQTAGAINITIEITPDGTNWYPVPEGVRFYGAATKDIIEIGYTLQGIKLTGSNTTNVTASILGNR